ncbi:IgGFc-binding protein-like [Lissotriton helveticus]
MDMRSQENEIVSPEEERSMQTLNKSEEGLWSQCSLLLVVEGPCSSDSLGKNFVTVFMQNFQTNGEEPTLQVLITGYAASTTVTVTLQKTSFSKVLTVNEGETVTLQIPSSAQLIGTGKFCNTVTIQADKDISVFSVNNKTLSTDTTIVYPTQTWGTEHYIVTPQDEQSDRFNVFSVINNGETNNVEIYLKGEVTFQEKTYPPDTTLSVMLEPLQAIQIQSNVDLTGTKVVSSKPTAVITGHTCTWKNSNCNHVYEQLLPTISWGGTFIVPAIPLKTGSNYVFITASQTTRLDYQAGSSKETKTLGAGEVVKLEVMQANPLYIKATIGIQVILYFTGWTAEDGTIYDPFMINIPDVDRYCVSYITFGLLGFDNSVILVAKTSATARMTSNKASIPGLKWSPIEGIDFSWSSFSLGKHYSINMIDGSSPFEVLSFGISANDGYGSPGTCIARKLKPSCSSVSCRKKEACQLIKDSPVCVPQSVSVCWGWGDPHYHTFDGSNYDFQGNCTYTFAMTCGADNTLPTFKIEVKNENLGNSKVSYVSFVTIKVYNYTISLIKFEYGQVRVNNKKLSLPVILKGGKLRLYKSGKNILIQTDFTLKVYYDWKYFLKIEISSSFFENICGLCGSYNGDPSDDFMMSSGLVAPNPIDFGASWKVEDGDRFCSHDCNGVCVICAASLVRKYEVVDICGMIAMKGTGPFRECHAVIDPSIYMENCVYDKCINDGFTLMLCLALETYADACQRKNIMVYEWRSIAGCPAQCPPNSKLVTCGNACPATCNDGALPEKCSEACVESCQCNPGFVLKEGECIAKSTCGCVFEGRQYAPGQRFWVNDKCTQQCTCNPQTNTVECKETTCKSTETCDVVEGIRDCFPLSYGTCTASADPHYATFDGVKYNFMGTCVYLFAGLCKKSDDLVDFQVFVQNDHRGRKVVSYTALVQIKVYEFDIIISKRYRNKIMLNGLLINLPYRINNGKLSIHKQGGHCYVQTNFGLLVTYDWKSYVSVKIPSTYAGAVCGLCGDFDGDRSKELTMKNNILTTDATAFGKSWKVRDVRGCSEADMADCPDLPLMETEQREKKKECFVLVDPAGPFRECHAVIDPQGAFKDCVYDACFYKGRQDIICQVIASYAAACQDAGIKVYAWRAAKFCSPVCGKNSHYEVCPNGCPTTCSSYTRRVGCNANCKEGCVCDDSFVLSGGDCVSLSQCGCDYNSFYYKLGEVFYPNRQCSIQCTCKAGGSVECKPLSCKANEECKIINGILQCHPIGPAQCSAAGDTHYQSFDGLAFDFQSTCTYTFSRTTALKNNLIPFEISIENEKYGNGKVAVNGKVVVLVVYGYILKLMQNKKGIVRVDRINNNLPLTLNDGNIRVYQHGIQSIVETDFGLVVSYDLVYHVVVTVPGHYKGQLEGLCGNYNGNTKDEFMLPSKTLAPDATKFGTGWRVRIAGVKCNEVCGGSGNACPVCPDAKKNIFKQDNYCGFLKLGSGPLSACYATINPDVYYNNCMFDLCEGNGDQNVLCHSIQSYVAACQAAGITIQPWRSDSFCPLRCPSNSQYAICADICSISCAGITDMPQCPTTCAEGCECNDGFFSDGKGCVSMDKCGCFENGKYYNPDETVLSADCKQACTCLTTTGLVCEDFHCAGDEKCSIKDGIAGCVNKDPCASIKCRTKETCTVKDGNPVCVPEFSGTCWAWGDPHYYTYDGYNYDFRGTCSYTISKYCGTDPTLVPFVIDEKNDNRGSRGVSYVRLVNIYVYGYKISIYKGEIGKIRINTKVTSLPVTLNDGQIKVVQSGAVALLQTDFGLQLSYEWNRHLIIVIPSIYYGATCGLCGNFNQNMRDEFQTPNGTEVTSIVDWAKSWQVQDQDPFCFHECTGVCPTCDDSKRALYRSEKFCGIISKTANGAFRECHSKFKPNTFFDSCLYDLCINGGATQYLCQALSVYAATCRKGEVKIYDWRTPAGCQLPCGENSHYEACGNACPASCSNRTAPATCTIPCVETCQCNDRYVLSVNKCVPVASCGCTSNGFYYKPNEEFWSDNTCQVRCKCDSTLGTVVCKNSKCKDSEKCMVVNGVQNCFPASYSTCTKTGDPHYTTFDGHRFDFMGTCVYQLVGLVSKDPSFTAFTVTVQNDNRGRQKVSDTKVVTLEAYGLTITLSKEFPHQILANGVLTALPLYFRTNRIIAFISGGRGVVKTDFEVSVTFDWNSHVRVSLPSTYANAVAGLCGNGNNVSSDDLTMKNGVKATTVAQFANSWKIRDVPGCKPGCTGSCPLCTDAEKEKYKSGQYCGVVNKVDGPFSKCYNTIDPTPFFNNCLFDACQYKGHFTATCNAITAYVIACQVLGIQIPEWRTPSFCSPSCPVNMHYEVCGNGCPATCWGLSPPPGCNALCTTGCFCNNGFILSGNKCVPEAQCGCVFKERYYKRGQEFYLDNGCKERCKCGNDRAVACKKVSCSVNEKCKGVNGMPRCQPTGIGKCVVSGDPHYISFDGLSFQFQGTCTYILTKVIEDVSRLRAFSVVVENESLGKGNVAVTRMVAVSVDGHTINIERGRKWKVKVDGEINNLPLTLNDGTVWINQEGIHIVLQTDFGLTVLYDTVYYVMISVPSTYKGKLGGLCGNFNGNKKDEFMLPNKKIAKNVKQFGLAWKVTNAKAKCRDDCVGQCPVCAANKIARYYKGTVSCGMITNTAGPFKKCHAKVSPTVYYNHCAYDLCYASGSGDILCKSLQAYAAACQAAGATISSWRTASFCPVTCGAKGHYELCTSTCDFGCALLAGPSQCTKQCFEGCQCDGEHVFDGDRCVSMNECGCTYNGRYLKLDELFVSPDCSQICTCSAARGLFCEELSCAENEFCTLTQGVRGCVRKEGTCTMTPGLGFNSFDGMSGMVPYKGPYEVTSLCDKTSKAWFRAVVNFQLCQADGAMLAQLVHVYFRDAYISIAKSQKAWRDGRELSFPAKISESVSVTIKGDSVVVEQVQKIRVQISTNGSVTVTASQDMVDNLCGACGNFNGDKGDDLKMANGAVAISITEVITSWKAQDLATWTSNCSPPNKVLEDGQTPSPIAIRALGIPLSPIITTLQGGKPPKLETLDRVGPRSAHSRTPAPTYQQLEDFQLSPTLNGASTFVAHNSIHSDNERRALASRAHLPDVPNSTHVSNEGGIPESSAALQNQSLNLSRRSTPEQDKTAQPSTSVSSHTDKGEKPPAITDHLSLINEALISMTGAAIMHADKLDAQINILQTVTNLISGIDSKLDHLNSLIRRAQDRTYFKPESCSCSPILHSLEKLPNIISTLIEDLKKEASKNQNLIAQDPAQVSLKTQGSTNFRSCSTETHKGENFASAELPAMFNVSSTNATLNQAKNQDPQHTTKPISPELQTLSRKNKKKLKKTQQGE